MEYREILRNLGVNDLSSFSGPNLQKVLDAYIRDRKINFDIVKAYLVATGPSVKALMQGLQAFSADGSKVASEVIDLIKGRVEALEKQLERAEEEWERKEIYARIEKLIRDAREESERNR